MIIRVVYAFSYLVAAWLLLAGTLAAIDDGRTGLALLVLISGVLTVPVTRVACETGIVLFRIAENTERYSPQQESDGEPPQG